MTLKHEKIQASLYQEQLLDGAANRLGIHLKFLSAINRQSENRI